MEQQELELKAEPRDSSQPAWLIFAAGGGGSNFIKIREDAKAYEVGDDYSREKLVAAVAPWILDQFPWLPGSKEPLEHRLVKDGVTGDCIFALHPSGDVTFPLGPLPGEAAEFIHALAAAVAVKDG